MELYVYLYYANWELLGGSINELKQPEADEFVNKTRRLVNGKVE